MTLKNTEGKCNCPCHRHKGIRHIVACCLGGLDRPITKDIMNKTEQRIEWVNTRATLTPYHKDLLTFQMLDYLNEFAKFYDETEITGDGRTAQEALQQFKNKP